MTAQRSLGRATVARHPPVAGLIQRGGIWPRSTAVSHIEADGDFKRVDLGDANPQSADAVVRAAKRLGLEGTFHVMAIKNTIELSTETKKVCHASVTAPPA